MADREKPAMTDDQVETMAWELEAKMAEIRKDPRAALTAELAKVRATMLAEMQAHMAKIRAQIEADREEMRARGEAFWAKKIAEVTPRLEAKFAAELRAERDRLRQLTEQRGNPIGVAPSLWAIGARAAKLAPS